MKLNPDCIRDTMFYLEAHLSISDDLKFEEVSIFELDQNTKYSKPELANTLIALHEAGFIEAMIDSGCDRITLLDIHRITYSGYQFIESIRPEPVWKKVKSVSTHIGSSSIDILTKTAVNVLSTMATGVLTSMATGQLNL